MKARLGVAWDALAGIDPAEVDSVVLHEIGDAQAAVERAIRKHKGASP